MPQQGQPSGIFAKILSFGGGSKKRHKVNLDTDDNTFYYNEKLGRWVERGKENEAVANAAPAPPPLSAGPSLRGSATSSSANLEQLSEETNGGSLVSALGSKNVSSTSLDGLSTGSGYSANFGRRSVRDRYPDPLSKSGASVTSSGSSFRGAFPALPGSTGTPNVTFFVPGGSTASLVLNEVPSEDSALAKSPSLSPGSPVAVASEDLPQVLETDAEKVEGEPSGSQLEFWAPSTVEQTGAVAEDTSSVSAPFDAVSDQTSVVPEDTHANGVHPGETNLQGVDGPFSSDNTLESEPAVHTVNDDCHTAPSVVADAANVEVTTQTSENQQWYDYFYNIYQWADYYRQSGGYTEEQVAAYYAENGGYSEQQVIEYLQYYSDLLQQQPQPVEVVGSVGQEAAVDAELEPVLYRDSCVPDQQQETTALSSTVDSFPEPTQEDLYKEPSLSSNIVAEVQDNGDAVGAEVDLQDQLSVLDWFANERAAQGKTGKITGPLPWEELNPSFPPSNSPSDSEATSPRFTGDNSNQGQACEPLLEEPDAEEAIASSAMGVVFDPLQPYDNIAEFIDVSANGALDHDCLATNLEHPCPLETSSVPPPSHEFEASDGSPKGGQYCNGYHAVEQLSVSSLDSQKDELGTGRPVANGFAGEDLPVNGAAEPHLLNGYLHSNFPGEANVHKPVAATDFISHSAHDTHNETPSETVEGFGSLIAEASNESDAIVGTEIHLDEAFSGADGLATSTHVEGDEVTETIVHSEEVSFTELGTARSIENKWVSGAEATQHAEYHTKEGNGSIIALAAEHDVLCEAVHHKDEEIERLSDLVKQRDSLVSKLQSNYEGTLTALNTVNGEMSQLKEQVRDLLNLKEKYANEISQLKADKDALAHEARENSGPMKPDLHEAHPDVVELQQQLQELSATTSQQMMEKDNRIQSLLDEVQRMSGQLDKVHQDAAAESTAANGWDVDEPLIPQLDNLAHMPQLCALAQSATSLCSAMDGTFEAATSLQRISDELQTQLLEQLPSTGGSVVAEVDSALVEQISGEKAELENLLQHRDSELQSLRKELAGVLPKMKALEEEAEQMRAKAEAQNAELESERDCLTQLKTRNAQIEAQFHDQHAKLQAQDVLLQQLRDSSAAECKSLRAELSSAQQQLASMRPSSNELLELEQAAKEAAEKQLEEALQQLADVTDTKNKIQKKFATLRRKADEVKAENGTLKEQLSKQQDDFKLMREEKEASISNKDSVISGLQQELEILRQAMEQQLHVKEEELERVREEANSAQAAASCQVVDLQMQLDTLQVEATSEDLQEKDEQIEMLRESLQDANELLNLAESKLKAKEDELSSHQQHVAAVQTELSDLQSAYTSLAEQLQGTQTQLDEQIAESRALHAEAEHLRTKLEEASEQRKIHFVTKAQLEACSAELGSTKTELEQLTEQQSQHLQVQAQLQQALQQKEVELEARSEALSSSQAEIERLKEQLSHVTLVADSSSQAATARDSDLQQLATDLQHTRDELEGLRQALSDATARLATAEAEALQKDKQLGTAQEEMQLKEKEAKLQHRKLLKAKQELKARTSTIHDRESELSGVREQLASLAAAQQSDQQAIAELRAENQRLRTDIENSVATLQGAKDLPAELARVQEMLTAQQAEFSDLLVCLGQESAKLQALQAVLEDQGVDVEALLDKVEEEFGFGDEADVE